VSKFGLEHVLSYVDYRQVNECGRKFDDQIVATLINQTRPLIDSAADNTRDGMVRQQLFREYIYPTFSMVKQRHPATGSWGSKASDEAWSMISHWIELLGKLYLDQTEEQANKAFNATSTGSEGL
jgi:hypothetical protein